MAVFLAHRGAETGAEQPLLLHLQNVSALAAGFAAPFGGEETARRCGLEHDIGKYSAAFQRRIRGAPLQTDHSTAGALESAAAGDFFSAFCIAGHHAGLPDGGNSKADTGDDATLYGRLKRVPGKEIEPYGDFRAELTPPPYVPPALPLKGREEAAFFVRMLFSCLVDADFLDTEAFLSPPDLPRGNYLDIPALLSALERHIAPWLRAEGPTMNGRRSEILRACLSGGPASPGLFTLTVPTGGGKTVSSMTFALRHAAAHGLRRVIYIIPYTSILEQTAAVFREIFGEEQVVVHYAAAGHDCADDDPSPAERRRQLAAENWDAPILLTTSVQFFESLYASRPSRCRKLHNIAKSVLIFDEAQMLPVPCLLPCVWAIGQLVRNYGCSAVLCTATQLALSPFFAGMYPELPLRELCPDPKGMYDFFRRVRYVQEGLLSEEVLAGRLVRENQVLCVVNTRAGAQSLFSLLPPEGAFHLSTRMTPAHRRETLALIRARLKNDLVCRVVSTSLIEAGVDVDFPTVYRQAAGLDSIIQAGGRCNREGRRGPEESLVHIFFSDERPPDALVQNLSVAEKTICDFDDLASPEAIHAYFSFLFKLKGEKALDKHRVLDAFSRDFFPFASVAERFQLIDAPACAVYIPTAENAPLLERLRRFGPGRNLLRRLGEDAVSVYPAQLRSLCSRGGAEPLYDGAAILTDLSLYRQETGLELRAEEGQGIFF